MPPERITELDWWDEVEVDGLRLVSTPARHFSARGVERNRTLWCSWAFVGPAHRLWFSGDTGPFAQASEIGERLGPFDLTMIEIGAWHEAWGTIHLGPDEAARMHSQVRGRVVLPVHWGTFALALHAWYQPIQRLREVAPELAIAAPLPGGFVDPDQPGIDPFWLRARGGV